MAEGLASLYDYMGRRLFAANLNGDAAIYFEVRKLLVDLRGSWVTLRDPSDARAVQTQPVSIGSARTDAAKAHARSLAA